MSRVDLKVSIEAEEQVALENLSELEGRPVEQLLSEAIQSYLSRRGQEDGLGATLAGLCTYRKRDPNFRQAIDAFVAAEAGLVDPVEGEPVNGEFVDGEFKPSGPVQSRIRDLLGA